MRRTVLVLVCAVGIIAGVVGPVTAAFAATTVTFNAQGGYWSVASNWSPASPQAGDDLVFPAPTSPSTSTYNDLLQTSYHSLSVAGSWLFNGRAISLTGGLTTASGSQASLGLPITVAAPQTFNLAGYTSVSSLTLNADADIAVTNSAWMALVGGTGTLTMSGPGQLSLTGSTTAAGQIVQSNGYLYIGGSFPQRAVSMTGGELVLYPTASGTLGPLNATGGSIIAGYPSCPACPPRPVLAVSGATLGSGASLASGVLTVAGSVTLNNPSLSVGLVPPDAGASALVVDNDGTDPVSGTFAGAPEGAVVRIGSHLVRVSYIGGTGNDVTITNVDPVYAYAATTANHLVRFDVSSPGTLLRDVPITGLPAGESILGIDFRTATGQLYGLGSSSRLYTINPGTGVATGVGTGPFSPALSGAAFAMEFDGKDDRIQVVSDTGQSLRINPNTGTVNAVNPPLAFPSGDSNQGIPPHVTALAAAPFYASQFYGIDSSLDSTVSLASGVLHSGYPLGVDTTSLTGADSRLIDPYYSYATYANLTVGSASQLSS